MDCKLRAKNCGGCPMLGMDYAAQLKQKEENQNRQKGQKHFFCVSRKRTAKFQPQISGSANNGHCDLRIFRLRRLIENPQQKHR